MKIPVMFYVALTTLLLIALAIMASMNMAFTWMFLLTIFGEAVIVLMVYRVLTDNYTTTKTFEDFYEDHPIGKEERFIE